MKLYNTESNHVKLFDQNEVFDFFINGNKRLKKNQCLSIYNYLN